MGNCCKSSVVEAHQPSDDIGNDAVVARRNVLAAAPLQNIIIRHSQSNNNSKLDSLTFDTEFAASGLVSFVPSNGGQELFDTEKSSVQAHLAADSWFSVASVGRSRRAPISPRVNNLSESRRMNKSTGADERKSQQPPRIRCSTSSSQISRKNQPPITSPAAEFTSKSFSMVFTSLGSKISTELE